MNSQEYLDYLLNYLTPWARPASGKREVQTRCKYCEDSKTYSHGHFYIQIPQSDEELSYYYCQKCHSKGIVTANKLMEWGIYDSELCLNIAEHNKKASKYGRNKDNLSNVIYRLNNTFVSQDRISEIKLLYINKRLGTNLNYNDVLSNKIVLNLYDLLNTNNIYNYTRDIRIVNDLDQFFLGFISYDNAFVNMRNLKPGGVNKYIDKRYVNYNIFGKYDNSKKFYVSPCTFDLYDTRPIQVHLAEGVFDILSVKYNLRKDFERSLYTAACGSGYKGLCRDIILDLKIPNLEFHIYPDADIKQNKMYDLYQYLKPFQYPVYIHRNIYDGEKDFGVGINHIKETVEKLF